MVAGSALRPVIARSEKITDPGRLVDLLPGPPAFAFVRAGEGLVGWGEAARIEIGGPDRFARADAFWQAYLGVLDIQDEVGVPGSGPISVASFAFAADPTSSVLIVPRVVIGRRGGVSWRTSIGTHPDPATLPRVPLTGVRQQSDPAAVDRWRATVAEVVDEIRAGRLDKAVLALSLDVTADAPIDPRSLLDRLVDRYPDTWSFLVDGLVGATPELLIERTGPAVRSRVLAGTVPRTGNPADDAHLAAELLRSAKDLEEHRLAAEPVAAALGQLCATLDRPAGPDLLELRNVLHLATQFTGRLKDDQSALLLAGALHPTPAVAGTPRDAAMDLIGRLEPTDRGRYAGPVGWTDSRGDGEFCLALRCAAIEENRARLFAGCGIVADSVPDTEVAEWQAKLRPMLDALA
jgi:menaquinone-specific isochorismate synthase